MPHIKWACVNEDFTFSVIHGSPPLGSLSRHQTSHTSSSFLKTCVTPPPIVTLVSKHGTNSLTAVDRAKHICLWLPSEILLAVRHLVCSNTAVNQESDLLQAEIHDRLVAIRKNRRAHNVVCTNNRGDWRAGSDVSIHTRQQRKISDIGARIEKARVRYEAAWKLAKNLRHNNPWSDKYQELHRRDICGPNPADDITDLAMSGRKHKGRATDLGQGTYHQSWIWLVALSGSDKPNESLRLHWCKTAANADRWNEELQLVQEEMRRVLAYFTWHAAWWSEQIGRRLDAALPLQEALDAHARHQHAIYYDCIIMFASTWIPALAQAGFTPAWTNLYRDVIPSHAWIERKRGQNLIIGEFHCVYSTSHATNRCFHRLYYLIVRHIWQTGLHLDRVCQLFNCENECRICGNGHR
jgi:hypothetical protein